MSGTILKVTTRGTARASNGSAKRLLLRAVHAGGPGCGRNFVPAGGSSQAGPPPATRNSVAAQVGPVQA